MVRKKMRKTLPWKTLLAAMLCALMVFCGPVTAFAAEGEATSLSLSSSNPAENVAFQVSNMLPGDSRQVTYRLNVSYTGDIQVCYKATVREGSEALAKALQIKVTTADASEVLYEGVLSEMHVLIQDLTASAAKTEELVYAITVSMDTAAGNEYQGLSATVDFSWWEGDPGVALLGLNASEPEQTAQMPLLALSAGTSYSTTYQLDVSYSGEVEVSCAADIPAADEKLAENLNVKVTTADRTNVIYEGLLSQMPVLIRELSSGTEKTDVLTYAVTVTLADGADAQYQNKDAAVSFVWKVSEVKNDTPDTPGTTGGDTPGTTGGDFVVDPTSPAVTPDDTDGGNGWILPVVIVVVVLGAAAVIFLLLRKKGPKGPNGAVAAILALTVLVAGLGISTVALNALQQNVGGSLFQTATVKISLSGSEPIFSQALVEPGMRFEEDFTVTNTGTADVYYRIKIETDNPDLAAALLVEVKKGDEVLFNGTMQQLSYGATEASAEALAPGEADTLTLTLKMAEDAGNNVQNQNITFNISVQAVQAANNPQGLFD